MEYTCGICKKSTGCGCGGWKCNCGLSKVESKTANNLINKYGLPDKDAVVEGVKNKKSLKTIVVEQMGEDFDFKSVEKPTSGVQYESNAMCVYQDLRQNTKCIYCGIERSKGFGRPCIYLNKKVNEQPSG